MKKIIISASVFLLMTSCDFPHKKIAGSNFSLINYNRPSIGYLWTGESVDSYSDVYTPYGDTIIDEIRWNDKFIYVALACHSKPVGGFKINYHFPVQSPKDVPTCIIHDTFNIDTVEGKNVRMGIFFQQPR